MYVGFSEVSTVVPRVPGRSRTVSRREKSCPASQVHKHPPQIRYTGNTGSKSSRISVIMTEDVTADGRVGVHRRVLPPLGNDPCIQELIRAQIPHLTIIDHTMPNVYPRYSRYPSGAIAISANILPPTTRHSAMPAQRRTEGHLPQQEGPDTITTLRPATSSLLEIRIPFFATSP